MVTPQQGVDYSVEIPNNPPKLKEGVVFLEEIPNNSLRLQGVDFLVTPLNNNP